MASALRSTSDVNRTETLPPVRFSTVPLSPRLIAAPSMAVTCPPATEMMRMAVGVPPSGLLKVVGAISSTEGCSSKALRFRLPPAAGASLSTSVTVRLRLTGALMPSLTLRLKVGALGLTAGAV